MSYLSSFPDLVLIVVVDTTAYLARFSQLQTVSAVIFVLFHVSLQLMHIFYIILLVECHGDAEVARSDSLVYLVLCCRCRASRIASRTLRPIFLTSALYSDVVGPAQFWSSCGSRAVQSDIERLAW